MRVSAVKLSLVLLIQSCVPITYTPSLPYTKVNGPTAGTWYFITCRSSKWNCFVYAGNLCQAGYEVIDNSVITNSYSENSASFYRQNNIAVGGGNSYSKTTNNFEMLVKCKEIVEIESNKGAKVTVSCLSYKDCLDTEICSKEKGEAAGICAKK